ncbi:MAG: hypothetical protein AAB562_01140, partial [Patescibacteria group bacterium]
LLTEIGSAGDAVIAIARDAMEAFAPRARLAHGTPQPIVAVACARAFRPRVAPRVVPTRVGTGIASGIGAIRTPRIAPAVRGGVLFTVGDGIGSAARITSTARLQDTSGDREDEANDPQVTLHEILPFCW